MAYEEGSDELVKAYKKATPGEDVVDPADKGEYDNEGQMAKTQLRGIVADASHMIQMFSDEQNLPEWVQNKITKSADYLNSAHRYMMNKEDVDEAIDFMSAGKYARVMNPKTREIKKVLKTDVRKYVQKGWTHMTQLKNRITKEETINERINMGDFVIGSEKAKDGYRAHVTYKKDGKTMYLGATSYKDKKTAEGEAEAYLLGYNRAGDRGAQNAAWKFKQKNEEKYRPATKAEIEADKKKDRKGKPRPSMSAKSAKKSIYKNMMGGLKEKLEVSDGMAAWIDDFQKSDAPQFEGKDKEERRNMAIAAYLAAKREEKDKGKSESSKAYGKSLRTMRDKEKNKRISSKDKETLGKLADLLAKEKSKRK